MESWVSAAGHGEVDEAALAAIRERFEKMKSSPPSKEFVDILIEFARAERADDTDSALSHAQEALDLSRKLELERYQAESLQLLGSICWTRSNYTAALKHLRQSLEVFEKLEDLTGISSVYDQMGSIYQEQGFTDIALEHYLESLKLMEKAGDMGSVANCYMNIGDIYRQNSDFTLAISSYTRAMAILEDDGDVRFTALCYFNLAQIYVSIGTLGEALDYCRRSVDLRRENGNLRGEAESLRYQGVIYEKLGELDSALDSWDRSLTAFQEIDDQVAIADLCCRKARGLIALERLDEAEVFLDRAREITGTTSDMNLLVELTGILSQLHEARNDLEKTLTSIHEYNRLRKEILESNNSRQFERLQILFETEIREQESEIYRLRNVELEDLVKLRTTELQNANMSLRNEINEHNTVEKARERAEATLRTFLDNVEDMVYYQSAGGSINHLNSACAVVTGYTKKEFDRDPELWKRIVHPEDVVSRIERLSSRCDGALVANQEYRLQKKTGEWCWIHSHMVAILDAKCAVTGYSCIDRDFTKRKESEQELQASFDSLEKSFQGTVFTMARIVETRDPYTSGHQLRVAELAKAIAAHMDLSDETVQTVFLAAVIHDIGKICIPQELLSKPGRLSEIEMNLIRTHPQVSFEILSGIDFPWPIADIVLQHHELFDGTGYPNGLSGEDISLEARILCAADVVEAMSSHRPYRPKLGEEIALEELVKHRGTRYDPDVVDACCALFSVEGYCLPEYSALIL
jgi:PAS domain S-box-containing protein/putative nucleotidyltransferase with HDIG domain